jgi:hypothetical protein
MRAVLLAVVLGVACALPAAAATRASATPRSSTRTAASGAAAVNDPPKILLWHQVGDVGIGMTRARVEYTYGRPPGNSPLGPTYNLHGGHIVVGYSRSGNVDQIRVDTPYYRAAGGFGVGYRIPLGPCHRTGNSCHYTWQGFAYDGVQTWFRSLVWSGAQMQVIVSVDRGVVKSFSISKLGAAGHSTAPTTATAKAIIAVVRSTVCGASPCPGAKIDHIRLARTDPSYATAAIYDPKVGGAAILLRRGGVVWKVIDYGSSQVGCGHAPTKVLDDLGLYCR